jgi:hypothetical protein
MHWAQQDQGLQTDDPEVSGRGVMRRAFEDAFNDFPREGRGE